MTSPDFAFRLALPKKGRLRDDFNALMEESGLVLRKDSPRHDYGTMTDLRSEIPAFEVLTQRPADAFRSLMDGVATLAVAGLDSVIEYNSAAVNRGLPLPLEIVRRFNGVSECRLCLAVPQDDLLEKPGDLQGRRIATAYPQTLARWLDDHDVRNVQIVEREGGIEDCIRLGLADAICDIVQSGRTLAACGLRPVMTLVSSSAVAVKKSGAYSGAAHPILQRLG